MIFMLIATVTSLALTIKNNILAITAGGAGIGWCYIRTILGILLIVLAIVLMVEGINTLKSQLQKTNKQIS